MLFLQNKISHTMTGFIQYKQTDTHRLYKADAIAWVYNNVRERKNQLSSYVTVSFCNSHFRFFFIGMLSFFALAKRDFAVFFSYLFIGKMQKRAENLREAVAWSETFLQSCGNLSLEAKPSCKAAGTFRLERNFLAKLREPFAWSETFLQSCENLSLGAKPCRKLASLFRSLRINN